MVSRREGYRKLVGTTARTAEPSRPVDFEITEPFDARPAPHSAAAGSPSSPARYTPKDATVRYTWLRDGEAIARATAADVRRRADDVGHRLSVRVDLRHAGYRDRSVTLRAAGPVTTEPTLRVTAEGRPRPAVVRVRVAAPGSRHPAETPPSGSAGGR